MHAHANARRRKQMQADVRRRMQTHADRRRCTHTHAHADARRHTQTHADTHLIHLAQACGDWHEPWRPRDPAHLCETENVVCTREVVVEVSLLLLQLFVLHFAGPSSTQIRPLPSLPLSLPLPPSLPLNLSLSLDPSHQTHLNPSHPLKHRLEGQTIPCVLPSFRC